MTHTVATSLRGCGTFAGGLPSLPHSNFGGKHGTFRGDAICWTCDASGLGGRLYPFSGEQVRVREADREITRLCAWGDKVHRKDRPEREEARGLERGTEAHRVAIENPAAWAGGLTDPRPDAPKRVRA